MAKLLRKRATGSLSEEKFADRRDQLMAERDAAKAAGEIPSRSSEVKESKVSASFVVLVLLVVAAAAGGLFASGVFSKSKTTSISTWWTANATTLHHLNSQGPVLGRAIRAKDLPGIHTVFESMATDMATLRGSGSPDAALTQDFSADYNDLSQLDSTFIIGPYAAWELTNAAKLHTFVTDLEATGSRLDRDDVIAHPILRVRACIADAKTVETAVGAYNFMQKTHPISKESGISFDRPDTFSHGREAQALLSNGLIRTWPAPTHGYAVSLSTTRAGDVSIYVPATSTTPVDFESESATTGCNALKVASTN